MNNEIYEYIKNGITIKGNPTDGYEVFTIPTQHFKIDSLHQLTPETFKNAIKNQHNKLLFNQTLMEEMFKETQNDIDQEIINQLMSHEPNPGIIPMDTIDRLYKNYKNYLKPDYGYEPDWMRPEIDFYYISKEEFTKLLLFDDDFYQKWGENCCEELTYIERYGLWFTINYETGMEYNSEIEPDWDNDYYEPTPKRKLK